MTTNFPSTAQIKEAFVETVSMVREFHECFGHPVRDELTALHIDRADQRFGYMAEELQEGFLAALAEDQVEMIDASGDAAYFAAGNLVESGITIDAARELIDEHLAPESDEQLHDMIFEPVQDELEQFTVGQLARPVFIGAMAEFSEFMIENREVQMDVVELSAAHLMGHLVTLYGLFGVDALEVMREIHRSNMSKLLPAELDSEQACHAFMAGNGCKVAAEDLKFERLDDLRWVAKHMSTNKIVKNPLYSGADLAKLAA